MYRDTIYLLTVYPFFAVETLLFKNIPRKYGTLKKDKRGGAEKKARGDCGGKRIMIKI
jgi:hypothetical protein